MKAAVLEDVAQMVVREVPDPAVGPHEVLIKVGAVGVCGTDLHLFQGHGNYNFDAQGRPIPLTVHPQILGHEFAGEIVEAGREVIDLRPGDRVLCDQGLNCVSRKRTPRCEYCASGDSHQCQYYTEHGITGLQGALAEYVAIAAVNCLKLPDGMSTEQGALVEPLGCVTHSSDRVDRARARYTFDGANGSERIRHVLICGAGPAGLLFVQYIRNIKGFDGLVISSDVREKNLGLARSLGATPVNAARTDLGEAVDELTQGERIHYLIDACAHPSVFVQAPSVLRKQATMLIYGAGHKGQDIGVIDPILFLEPTVVIGIGASGRFDSDGRSSTYRRALEMVSSKKVQNLPFVTHRYTALEDVHYAFERDFQRPDYIKGVLNCE